MGPSRRSRGASRLLALSAVLLGAALATPAHAAAAFALRSLGSFDHPVYAAQAPGSPDLVFVVEQPGVIRVLKDGVEQTRPFLDISSLVEYGGEQGLLSVAFDPNYAQNRRFYVFYVNRDAGHDLEIDQYRRSRTNPLRAPLTSRRTIITIQHNQADHHNGGQLQFGPDGDLYISTGDGGTQMDPEDDAQSPDSLLGKLLRIEPLAAGGYTSPATNPFASGSGRDEIYALGLRNPWRFSFDSATGALTIGDVGYQSWEEVDYVANPTPGMNFGWNDFEGTHETPFGIGANADPRVDPVFEYSHANGSCAVTGGYVVHDPALPALAGQYLFTDFCATGVYRISVPNGGWIGGVGVSVSSVSSFGEGLDGRIYVVSLDGGVYRLVQV